MNSKTTSENTGENDFNLSGFADKINPDAGIQNLMIKNIIKEFIRECILLDSSSKDLTSTSIRVRNLYEIFLTLSYVLKAQRNLENWIAQANKNQSDCQELFICLFRKAKANISELASIKKSTDEDFDKTNFSKYTDINLRDIAKDEEFLDEYNAIHKLCSLLAHPTSYKVNGYDSLCANDSHIKLLIKFGSIILGRMIQKCLEIKFNSNEEITIPLVSF